MTVTVRQTPIAGSVIGAAARALADVAPSVGAPVPSLREAVEHIALFEERFGRALAAVDAFEASTAPGKWPKLLKSRVVTGVRNRVVSPWLVEQGPAPFCGPAAIGFELIRHDPVGYVRIMRELFESGSFVSRTGHEFSPTRSLRVQPTFSETSVADDGTKTTRRVNEADWMLMATLREQANLALDVEEPTMFLQGLTTAWEMVEWSKKLLGFDDVTIHKAKPWGELGVDTGATLPLVKALDHLVQALAGKPIGPRVAVRAALAGLGEGGSAFLMLNSALVNRAGDPGFAVTQLAPNVATHWVSLVDERVDLVRRADARFGWTRKVANDGVGADGDAAVPLREPRSRVGEDDVELSMFTWADIEYRRVSVQKLRRHLFAVVTAHS